MSSSPTAIMEQQAVDECFHAAMGFCPGDPMSAQGCAVPPLFFFEPRRLPKPAVDQSLLQHLDNGSQVADSLQRDERHAFGSFTGAGSVAIIEDPVKGRCLIATAPIAAGDVVLVDASCLTIASNGVSFDEAAVSPPTTAAHSSTAGKLTSSPQNSSSSGLAAHLAGDETRAFSAAQEILHRARRLYGPGFVDLRYAQVVASLLVQHGDMQLIDVSNKHPLSDQSASDRFRRTLARRHLRAVDVVGDLTTRFWRATVTPALLHVAMCVLSVVPADPLLTRRCAICKCADMSIFPDASGELPHIEGCECADPIVESGFLARHGLHEVPTLAALFAAVDGNAIELQVPGLSHRVGVFPTLRLCEHECRPSCSVAILDSPATHCGNRLAARDQLRLDAAGKGRRTDRAGGDYLEELRAARKGSQAHTVASRELLLTPSVALLVAVRDMQPGDRISIAYIPSACMTQQQRQKTICDNYGFTCSCRWCVSEPDLPRGFRCPSCPKNQGVICPVGDGQKLDMWECLQCGQRADVDLINRCLDAERALVTVKADKVTGLTKLLDDAFLHYSHAHIFRKLDLWAEAAWKEQDATMCQAYIEALLKCVDRILQRNDAARAQYHEFLGQVMHALGNAHTARYEYSLAYVIRVRSGHRLTHWARRSRYMAEEKSLADFMDSK